MKQRMFVATLSAGALALTACAHTVPVEGAATPASSVSTSPGGGRWNARITSVMQNRGDVGQSTRDNSYGSADWTRGAGPTLSVVNLTFTYSGQERDLSWALIAGNCGMAALPLIPMANFSNLSVGSGGRAQITASLPLELPASGTYHVDIYKNRSGDPSALVGCGNFRYNAK
ncbi:MAG TPA: hypothetical protein VM053_06945 [Gemmatimonadaceae bacterium]|nr:hypothetical protein [Gemmatimonadaceae bacterium]